MSGQTSLSRQLEKLKVPQTSVQKETKGSVSFLYDFIEAKSIDNDMHYAMAVMGLNSLIEMEPRIQRYTQTLFCESSKTLDRALQSRETNNDLDHEIESYLFTVVCNYFLLSSTHKTIEWLIYRFRVNEYNTNALIASVLPYHECRLFARLVQTCTKLKSQTSEWFWLKPIQLSGTPLPKSTLINHCISHLSFLRYICDHMCEVSKLKVINGFTPFFVSTLINVIQRNTNEEMIGLIMGYVITGIKSKCLSFRRASYCITSHLCSKLKLKYTIIETILRALVIKPSVNEEVFVMLSIMGRHKQFDYLPIDLIESIDANELIAVNQKHNINDLIATVLKSIIKSYPNPGIDVKLEFIVSKSNLTEISVYSCVSEIADKMKIESNQSSIKLFSAVISLLEKRYPIWFDKCLSRLDSIASIAPLLNTFKYSYVESANVPLIIGLNHENQLVQKNAIEYFIKNFDLLLLQKEESALSEVKTILIDICKHQSPQILISLFGLKEKMFKIFNEEEMRGLCENLLNICHNKEEQCEKDESISWSQLKNSIIATYCSIDYTNKEPYFSLIYQYLLPLNRSDFDTLAIILESKSAQNNEMLSILLEKCKPLIETTDRSVISIVTVICNEMTTFLTKNQDLISENNFIQKNSNHYNFKSCLLSLLILERMHSQTNNQIIKQKSGLFIVNIIEIAMNSFKIVKPKSLVGNYEDFIHICVKKSKKTRICLSTVVFIIDSLIDSIDSKSFHNKSSDYFWNNEIVSNNCYFNKLFVLLFDNCYDIHYKKQSLFRQTLFKFSTKIFSVIGYDFFAAFWVNNINPVMQTRSLALSSNFESKSSPLSKTSLLSLLISLHSPLPNNRQMAVQLLKSVSQNSNDKFLMFCLTYKELMISDENQISYCVAKWVETNAKDKSPKKGIKSLSKQWLDLVADIKTPDYIKCGIIMLLNKCNSEITMQLLAIMSPYIDITCPTASQMRIIMSLMSIYSVTNIFENIDSESNIGFDFFIKSLKTKCAQDLAVDSISRELFDSIKENELKILILRQLLLITINNSSNKTVKKKLKKILINGNLISCLLQDLIPIMNTNDYSSSAKKTKTISQTEFSIESMEWKMFVTILEVFQLKTNLTDILDLTKSLIEYLKMTFILESKSSFEYLRQLILSSLITCIHIHGENSESPYIQIDSIIECLRESHQRETQRIALTLISKVAPYFVKEILDYVITIFTFIGTNLLNCDDQYTIQVVFDTMDAVIPMLLQESEHSKDVIINVFTDSLSDIPAHRRLHLFEKLVTMLGPNDHLWVILMKIIEKSSVKNKIEKQAFFSLGVALCSQFNINIQIRSMNKLMDIFALDFNYESKREKKTISENDRKAIANNFTETLLQIFSSQPFIETAKHTQWSDWSRQLLKFLHSLISLIIKYTNAGNELLHRDVNNHRRRIRNGLYKILMEFNSLLPNQQLIELFQNLMQNDSYLIQRKALELMNEKLKQVSSETLDVQHMNDLLEIMTKIVPTADSLNQMDDYHVYNIQLAMITLKLLSSHAQNEDNIKQLNKLNSSIISMVEQMKSDISVNLKASCILCITQLVTKVGTESLPLLSSVMRVILQNFNNSDEVIVISNMTAVAKISQQFPQFLSPYLNEIIVKLLDAYNKNLNLKPRLKPIWVNFAKLIPKRVLIDSLDKCYDEVVKISQECVCEMMNILKLTLENTNKDDINSILISFKNLLLKALDFRNLNHNKINLEVIWNLENTCNDAFSVLIPKMNETTFRPLFYKLYDWAIREKNGQLYQRMISFYNFSQFLAEKLKSLFCIFIAPSIMNNCSQMLNQFHPESGSKDDIDYKAGHILVCSILGILSKCFMYDIRAGFSTQERMQVMTNPLLNQLTNTLGSDDDYEERLRLLCLCTQHLIQSNRDDTLIKSFNYIILLKTRDTSSKIRCGALRVLNRLILVSGEEYLPFIPEAIPFISELSEDDSNDVENLVQTIVADLEQILGEPITKYL